MAEAAGLLGLTAETPNQVLPITVALELFPTLAAAALSQTNREEIYLGIGMMPACLIAKVLSPEKNRPIGERNGYKNRTASHL